MKNKIITTLLFVTLVLPLCAEPENTASYDVLPIEKTEAVQQDVIQDESQETLLPAAPVENISSESFKTPISKRKIVKKFILAMLGVVVSSLIIYFGLSIYNKIRDGFLSESSFAKDDDRLLSTPNDITEALKSFLERTKWD